MAIKAGQILHAMNNFIVDRIQTGGPGNLNIPQEKIYELGNYQSVATVRDVPDLTFTLDCLDVDVEVEELLTGYDPATAAGTFTVDPTALPTGTQRIYDLAANKPVDIVTPFKTTQPEFDVVRGVAVPNLSLESASYRYGLRENAGENFSLRGDSIFYTPGSPLIQDATGDGATTTFNFANGPALLYVESGANLYALNVSVNGTRQIPGTDYTETNAGVTFTTAPANGANVRLVYATAATTTYNQGVHQGVSVKPAAIRGKDIQVYVGTTGATSEVQTLTITGAPTGGSFTLTYDGQTTAAIAYNASAADVENALANLSNLTADQINTAGGPLPGTAVTITFVGTLAGVNAALITADGAGLTGGTTPAATVTTTTAPVAGRPFRWSDVQSVTVDWRVTIEDDYEFGNARAVARDYADAPTVNGTVEIKPITVAALFTKLQQITGVPAAQIVGPQSSVALPLEIVLKNPDSGGVPNGTTVNGATINSGTPLKTLYIPDARFQIPGYEGRVQQKMVQTLNWESDGGVLQIYRGARPYADAA